VFTVLRIGIYKSNTTPNTEMHRTSNIYSLSFGFILDVKHYRLH